MGVKHGFFKVFHRAVMQPYLRQQRGMTLGARTAVIDGEGRILLVRHTYTPGWLFPGGGVERGETCAEAAARELEEEAAIIATGPLVLHGVYSNHGSFPGDHLVFYVLREFARRSFAANTEIAGAEFFAADDLPADTTPASRRRIDEILGRSAISGHW